MRIKFVTTILLVAISSLIVWSASAQEKDSVYSFAIGEDVTVTMDLPVLHKSRETIVVIYALPNGNTTAQTMGKKLQPGDDWHYDIQHIKAQTRFIRHTLTKQDLVVVYLENKYKSWPQFKKLHANYTRLIPAIVDTVFSLVPANKKSLYLNGHSGGGSFIFGYLQSIGMIPSFVKRISFLDSEYGYDSSYLPAIKRWLQKGKTNLSVFAYNDSVALYNGKPVVSATGGTWYRSRLMMKDLSAAFTFEKQRDDSLVMYTAANQRIQFVFKTNPDRAILHTVQVERNGFIHSILCGTRYDSKGYQYFSKRAYDDLVE